MILYLAKTKIIKQLWLQIMIYIPDKILMYKNTDNLYHKRYNILFKTHKKQSNCIK